MATGKSKKVIYAAFIGNGLIAISKFVAAGFTGSSAMLSEGIHSVVDCGNQLLLLFGMKRAAMKPDKRHPFGYGMELYFWTFVVAILIFAVGAGVSIYEGIERIRHPHPITDAVWNYAVLSLGMVFEGIAWYVAYREFNRQRGDQPFFEAVRHSKDPTVFTVLFEDSAAMLGLFIAFLGVAGVQYTGIYELDGIASVGIGVVLAVVAVLLAIEAKGLLIGESADPEIVEHIENMADGDERIWRTNEILTMHLGPDDILVNASFDFVPGLTADDVEAAISQFERSIKGEYPSIRRVFIEAQSWRAHLADASKAQEE